MDCGRHYGDGGVALRQGAALVAALWGFRLQVLARRPVSPAVSPSSLCEGMRVMRKPGLAVHFNTGWDHSENCGVEKRGKRTLQDGEGFL